MKRMRVGALLLFVLSGCGGAERPPATPAATPPSLPPSMAGAPSGDDTKAAKGDQGAPAAEKSTPEVERAIAAIKANDFKSAKGALDIALTKNPKNATASYYMGVTLENLGDKPGAEQKYKDALASSPDLSDASVNLGALYLDQSKWDDAIAITQKALGKRSDDPALHANMAVALRGKGDKEGAAIEYERAVKVSGDNPELRFSYGSLLLEMGNKPKAATELKGALGAAGSNRALLASIGMSLGSAGAFADCIAAFDRAITAGDDAELRVHRGLCRHAMKDDAGAKSDFEAAVKANPKLPAAHYYLGESLLADGNTPLAIKEFDAASSAAPQSDLGKKAKARADAARKTPKKSK